MNYSVTIDLVPGLDTHVLDKTQATECRMDLKKQFLDVQEKSAKMLLLKFDKKNWGNLMIRKDLKQTSNY